METRKKFANSTVVKDIVKLLFIVYCFFGWKMLYSVVGFKLEPVTICHLGFIVKNVVEVAFFSLFSCFTFDKILFYLLANIWA